MEKKEISYRRFMMKLSQSLTQDDIDYLKYFYGIYVPSAKREKIVKGIDLFTVLERASLLGPNKMDTLRMGFETINRGDLLEEIEKQVAHLENEFEEVQQNMKEVFEEYQDADSFLEHDGLGDEKQHTDDIETDSSGDASFVRRHGSFITGKKLNEPHGDLDEWDVKAELQVDVNDGSPKDTREDKSDAHDVGGSEADNVVPNGGGNNHPDAINHENNEKPQNLSKMPSEFEDEDTMNTQGALFLQDSQVTPNKKKSAPSSSDNEFVNRNEDVTSAKPSSGASCAANVWNPTIHNEFDCVKPGFHEVPEVPSVLESDGESNKHSTHKPLKEPSEDESLGSYQGGKILPVSQTGKEEDGPGGLATPDFGSHVFNEEVPSSSASSDSYSSQGEQIFVQQITKVSLNVSGTGGFAGPVQGNTCAASSSVYGTSFGTLGTPEGNLPGNPKPFVDQDLPYDFACGCGSTVGPGHSPDNPPVSMSGPSVLFAGSIASSSSPIGATSGVCSAPCNSGLQTGSMNHQTIPTAVSSTGYPSPNCTIREGFQVEIPEGKHENTADGAKVIMPGSGMNFSIIVINKNQFDAELDINYGEKFLGVWLVEPGKPLTVEGPSYEKGKLFYSTTDGPGKNKQGSSFNNNITCIFKPDSDAVKINVVTTYHQRMGKERFKVVWGKSQSFQTLREDLQQKIRESITGFVVHNEIQDPSRTLSEAGIESGDTVQVLLSEHRLLVELPDGQLLEPKIVDPITVAVDDIKCYVQECKDKHPAWQRLSFQGKAITKKEELFAVFLSENPIIKVDFAEKLVLRVNYNNEESKITENTFSTVKTLNDKMEQICENAVVLKFSGEILDDESKLLQDYGIVNNAVIEVEQRRNDRSVMRGADVDALGIDDDEDDFEGLFDGLSGARDFETSSFLGSTSVAKFHGGGSPDNSEETCGKKTVEGDVNTNAKFRRDEESRTFQEELKVEISLQLVTRVPLKAGAQST